MAKEIDDYMLTTHDNPFNPFTDFETWYKYDMTLGHDCCGELAREACISDVASDEVNDGYVLAAMDRLVERWPLIFKKVSASDYDLKVAT